MIKSHKRALWCLIVLVMPFNLQAQPFKPADLDSIVQLSMQTFQVPGIAVCIISHGTVLLAKGYGVRSIQTGQKMDENTLFAIASNSKAFTVAALGKLVDEGKLSWDDRVTDIIPEFRLYDPYVTESFTIRDLLTHRSGLGLGAGDLMIWPDSANFTREELIHNLRYLKPVSGFRSKYDYDNLMYIVAGEVVARISGMSWENFVEQRIMQPLGMTHSAASYNRLRDKSNVIDAHVPVNGILQVVPKELNEMADAAGGIYSNVTDMSKWVVMQLQNGKYAENEPPLFSEKVHNTMWSPQTIMPLPSYNPYHTHFMTYGLGWRLCDVMGYQMVTHTGGLLGIVTQVTLIPELELGILVFTNQECTEAFTSITNSILDRYFGLSADRISELRKRREAYLAQDKQITRDVWNKVTAAQHASSTGPDLRIYMGTYRDNWFGKVIISAENGRLWFDAERSPKLHGEMFYDTGNTFIVKWRDRTLDADAYVLFDLDETGKASGLHMKPVSPLTDFSYDFQDLDFHRVNP